MLYVKDKFVKPPDFKHPNVDSLVKIAQIEKGKSEVSCVINEDDHGLSTATPMVHTDDSRPSDFTFAHMAMQTDDQDDDDPLLDVPEELRKIIGCRWWLVNLEAPAAITPSMLRQPSLPRHPQPDGPTPLTMSQLLDSQLKFDEAHRDGGVSKMIKGVLTKMHCLVKFSREAGLTPYMGHAHYLHACYLKSKITSRSPLSDCNLESIWSSRRRSHLGALFKDLAEMARLGIKWCEASLVTFTRML